MGAGNVEDPPMAVVLMIRLQRMISSENEVGPHQLRLRNFFRLSVLPGRTTKLPIPSALLFALCLEGIPKLEWSAWRVLRSGKRHVAGLC